VRTRPQPWFNGYINQNPTKQVAVIGGGISGASTAYSLAKRGFNVTLFEKNSDLALEASGNLQAILYANFFGNWQPNLELSGLGYNYSNNLIRQLLIPQTDFDDCGIIQLAYSDKLHKQQQQLIQHKWLTQLARLISPDEIADICGNTRLINNNSGLYFPNGMWVCPANLVKALVNSSQITVNCNTEIIQLDQLTANDKWQLLDNNNHHHQFDNVVVCNAFYATKFSQLQPLAKHLRIIRGQISIINQANNLKRVICNSGYITPSINNRFIIGATFKFDNLSNEVRDCEHLENLANFTSLLPQITAAIDMNTIEGKVGFRSTSNDYMPLVGPLAKYTIFKEVYKNLAKDANYWLDEPCPYLNGLFLNLGHGSKGLLTAPISGEIIANYIENNTSLISKKLQTALHPNRFYCRELIKNSLERNSL
jgi:tRNA 5-methylaminomethyl-2-thiouridine biosynthesis bifunctional protein